MYSRSYTERGSGILIPESYGGTAFIEETEEKTVTETPIVPELNGEKERAEKSDLPTEEERREDSVPVGASPLSGLFGKLPFGNLLGNVFGNGRLGLQSIGTEEILIIATAAFLLFSKDGDKECAIMLLLLLFIT